MKKLKKLLIVVVLFGLFTLTSCLSSPKTEVDDYPIIDGDKMPYYKDIAGGMAGGKGDAIIGGDSLLPRDGSPEDITNEQQMQAHQLSAAAYDDNEHYEFWKSLLVRGQTEEEDGIFAKYFADFSKSFNLKFRLRLHFKDIIPYSVKLLVDGEKEEYSVVPTKDGYVSLFSKEYKEEYNVEISYFDENGDPTILKETITGDKEYELVGQNKFINSIDLMFLIDTTGSMGDEISYLKAEMADVIEKVTEKCEDVLIRLSIFVYRDLEDEYVTKYNDFSTNIDESLSFLQKQHASGGGDFEEAVEVAYEEALQKSWSSDLNTKILVFVADAPAHDDKVAKWSEQLMKAASMGVRVITVASSGIDKKTEYFFRCGSLMTGGIYTYLTNDSGIGGSHIEATVEEKPTVEFLNSMLIRLIVGYHTGEFEEPVPYKKVNEEQNPTEGGGEDILPKDVA